MRSRRPYRTAAVVVAALAVLTPVWAVLDAAPGPRTSEQRITVAPGITLDTTLTLPATGGQRAPAVLLAHGFGGDKEELRTTAADLAGHGYAVLGYSARGFGDSSGQISLNAPDHEIRDASRLLDWLAARPEVLLDGPGDPRVGVAGASYGGALALLAAGHDRRVDAIAPQLTWYDLADAFFPEATGAGPRQGVFKKTWAGAFFSRAGRPRPADPAAPNAAPAPAPRPGLDPLCGRFTPQVCAVYQDAAVTGRATEEAVELLRASSPVSVADRITAPTLLVQGQSDSLFGLDQADRTARALAARRVPHQLAWVTGGHDGGDPESERVRGLVTDWFDRWLKRAPVVPAPGWTVSQASRTRTTMSVPRIRVLTAPTYPGLDGTSGRPVTVAGPEQTIARPPGSNPAAITALPGLGALSSSGLAGAVSRGLGDLPGQFARFVSEPLDASLAVFGSPGVSFTVSGTGGRDVPLFVKVYDVGPEGASELPRQLVAPVRVGDGPVRVRLPAIAHRFDAGHRIALVVATTDSGYATDAEPVTLRIGLDQARDQVRLPLVSELRGGDSALPVWVWAAPLGALGVAAGLLWLPRLNRRRRPGPATGPTTGPTPANVRPGAVGAGPVPATEPKPAADQPVLLVTDLTKRYGDHQAVAGLSLRVERGQVLGLLGPNGAGKTTTLRMVLGLITPDSGHITLFGQPVRPGAAVLSRVGAFVEGPGFLPHLSGRANLSLYWRATGRPAEQAGMEWAVSVADLGSGLDRPVREYSQGMRQRLAIAQAMLGLPDLLVLDEPTNGLDPPQIARLREVLRRYAADGRTVIVSSHLLAEVEQTCSHAVVVHRGQVVAAGPVEEVSAGNGVVVHTPDAELAHRELATLPGVALVARAAEGVRVLLDGLSVPDLVVELVECGVRIERVVPSRRLEDAFLELVGDDTSTDEGAAR